MHTLFSQLKLCDVHEDVFRNIVSIHSSQDLFDDLSADPHEWALAQQVENEVKPPVYQSSIPVIDRPFEDAHWNNAIQWPFRHWQNSRFSDGSFGVWYGAGSVETTVFETAYHWLNGFLSDAGFEHEKVSTERKVYQVRLDAALLDLRPQLEAFPALNHKTDYSYAQSVGARLHHEGHPGLITNSVRHAQGHNFVVLNPALLSHPRHHCQLRYVLDNERIQIEKQAGKVWMEIPISF